MKNRLIQPEKADEIWHLLCETLSNELKIVDEINEFRKVINPPPLLNSFSVIAQNLPSILDIMSASRIKKRLAPC
jgi:hypothetical protein